MLHNINLVIFDCDGVLVDSEYLGAKITAKILSEAGHKIDAETLSRNYAGLPVFNILKAIEAKSNVPLSYNLVEKIEQSFREQMPSQLKTIGKIDEILKKLTIPYCICSNGSSKHILAMLDLFELTPFFKGRIFSAPEMGTKLPKPDPNIFLYAAKEMQVLPEDCLVIEDSVHGIKGAVAAGMRPIGFTGGRHTYPSHAEDLSAAGAETVYNDHCQLLPLIEALKSWKNAF